jgi:hypothetical protein
MYICELTFPVIILNKSELRAALTDDYFGALLKIAATEEAPDFNVLVYAWPCCSFSVIFHASINSLNVS